MKALVFCFSTWHIDVLCGYFLQHSCYKSITVVISLQSDALISDKVVRLTKDDVLKRIGVLNIRYEVLYKVSDSPSLMKADKISLFWPGGFNINHWKYFLKFRVCSYISFDEGTSTYYPRSARGILNERNRRDYIKDIILYSTENVLSLSGFLTRYNLFHKSSVNKLFANNLGKFYDLFQRNTQIISSESDDSYALLVLDYDEYLGGEELLKFYEELVSDIRKNGQLKVKAKCHPNSTRVELYDRFFKCLDVELIKKRISAEELVYNFNISSIYFGISTSGLIIEALKANDTFCFAPRYFNLKGMSEGYRKRTKNFIEVFEKYNILNFF